MTSPNADLGRVIAYRCEDCCYQWPLRKKPAPDAECDNCGGSFEPVHEFDGVPRNGRSGTP